jgi:hypothetical protein
LGQWGAEEWGLKSGWGLVVGGCGRCVSGDLGDFGQKWVSGKIKLIFGPAVNFISVRLVFIMSNKTHLNFLKENLIFETSSSQKPFSNKFCD